MQTARDARRSSFDFVEIQFPVELIVDKRTLHSKSMQQSSPTAAPLTAQAAIVSFHRNELRSKRVWTLDRRCNPQLLNITSLYFSRSWRHFRSRL